MNKIHVLRTKIHSVLFVFKSLKDENPLVFRILGRSQQPRLPGNRLLQHDELLVLRSRPVQPRLAGAGAGAGSRRQQEAARTSTSTSTSTCAARTLNATVQSRVTLFAVSRPFRVSACAARTLNATVQSRVTRYRCCRSTFKRSPRAMPGGRGPEIRPQNEPRRPRMEASERYAWCLQHDRRLPSSFAQSPGRGGFTHQDAFGNAPGSARVRLGAYLSFIFFLLHPTQNKTTGA